jgi:hypothetical protein
MKDVKNTTDFYTGLIDSWRTREAALHYKIPQYLRRKGERRSSALYCM